MVRERKLPERFAERVLELELLMDQQKERTSVLKIRELLSLYADAIEYYGSLDMDKYLDLNARMQNTLVRPYVLAVLDRDAEERKNMRKKKAANREESFELKAMTSPRIEEGKVDRRVLSRQQTEDQRLLDYDTISDLAETAEVVPPIDNNGNKNINTPSRTNSSSTHVSIIINGEEVTPSADGPTVTGLQIVEKIEKSNTNNIVAVKQDMKAQEASLKERLKQRRMRKKFPLGGNSGLTTRSGYAMTYSNYTSDSERSIDASEQKGSFPATPTPLKKTQLSKNPQDCGNLHSPTGLRINDTPVLPVEESANMIERKKEVWTLCYSNYATFREKLEQELEDFIEKSLQFKHEELEKVEKDFEAQMKASTEEEQAKFEESKVKEMKALGEKLDEERKRGIQKLKEQMNRSREEEKARQREQMIQKLAVGDLPNF